MMSSEEERTRELAEALKGKTTRKILDFLSEKKEASETDIATGLKLPINTVEYNLKKLLKTGMVEKSKRFFWSRKGKKIAMYKLSKKHIIISPKAKKPSYSRLKNLIPTVLIAGLIFVLFRAYFISRIVFGAREASEKVATLPEEIISAAPNYFVWFVIGATTGLILYFIWHLIFGKKDFK